MNHREASELVAGLIKADGLPPSVPGVSDDWLINELIDIYAECLRDVSYANCVAAVHVLMDSSKHWPSICEIRELASTMAVDEAVLS